MSAEKLKVAFGNALAPWVMPDTDSGILLEILKEAMEPLGYKIEPHYYPYARRIKSYKLGLVDATSDMNPNTIKEEGLKGAFTGEIYAYENFAYTLNEAKFQFNDISDLGSLRLLSWQGAIAHLGEAYAKMASNNLYTETHNQKQQVKMLFLKRVDVVQLDAQIFNYYRKQVSSEGNINTAIKIKKFPLFGKSPNGFLFRDAEKRAEFNRQFNHLIKTEKLKKIYNRYK